jgi:hypothetical protein
VNLRRDLLLARSRSAISATRAAHPTAAPRGSTKAMRRILAVCLGRKPHE